MDRARALALLHEYVSSPSLRTHCLAVEASMRHQASLLGGEPDQWGLAGLLHDFDYERWPDPPAHTREGAAILRAVGCDEEIVGAILSHADWNLDEFPRDRPIRKALFAVDELSGFIVACARVRPDKLAGLEAKSVIKKLKTPAFAAAVSRADIDAGAQLLGVELDTHVSACIVALRGAADALGLST